MKNQNSKNHQPKIPIIESMIQDYPLANIPVKYNIFISNKLLPFNPACSNKITMIISPQQSHYKLKIIEKNNIIPPIQRIEIFIRKVEIFDISKPFPALNKRKKHLRSILIRHQWRRNE